MSSWLKPTASAKSTISRCNQSLEILSKAASIVRDCRHFSTALFSCFRPLKRMFIDFWTATSDDWPCLLLASEYCTSSRPRGYFFRFSLPAYSLKSLFIVVIIILIPLCVFFTISSPSHFRFLLHFSLALRSRLSRFYGFRTPSGWAVISFFPWRYTGRNSGHSPMTHSRFQQVSRRSVPYIVFKPFVPLIFRNDFMSPPRTLPSRDTKSQSAWVCKEVSLACAKHDTQRKTV